MKKTNQLKKKQTYVIVKGNAIDKLEKLKEKGFTASLLLNLAITQHYKEYIETDD